MRAVVVMMVIMVVVVMLKIYKLLENKNFVSLVNRVIRA